MLCLELRLLLLLGSLQLRLLRSVQLLLLVLALRTQQLLLLGLLLLCQAAGLPVREAVLVQRLVVRCLWRVVEVLWLLLRCVVLLLWLWLMEEVWLLW